MIVPETPITRGAVERRRTADPLADVIAAWTQTGAHITWHRRCQAAVRKCMPVLADALDRLVASHGAH